MDELNSFLGEDSELGTANESVELTQKDTTEILLSALESTFDTMEEYSQFLQDSATEMELYGIGDGDTIATEAKRVVAVVTKQSELSKAERAMCIKLAARGNDTHYEKYKKYKALFLQERDYLRNKYKTKAKAEVRKVMQNKSRKASTMSSPTGKNILNRIDRSLATTDKNGRNRTAIKK